MGRSHLNSRRTPASCLLQLFLLMHALFVAGCVRYHPMPLEESSFRERIVYESRPEATVGAVALGQRESRDLFGVPLADQGIQPVWLEIENRADAPAIFLQQSVDPAYFAAREVAYKSRFSPFKRFFGFGLASLFLWPLILAAPFQYFSARSANTKMERVLTANALGNRSIAPAESVQGFVYTHLDEGTKEVRVVLLRREGGEEVRLYPHVPGARLDHLQPGREAVYAPDEIRDLDAEHLVGALESLPATTTNRKGTGNGDPVNLVVVGDFDEVLQTFTRAGWYETEILDVTSSLRSMRSFLFGSSYRYAPMSDQFLFGRSQDVAFQKTRTTIHERNHLRLWYAPMRFEGKPVWVGQINRDIGVKFTLRTWNLTTHAVDPEVDDSRENVTGDLLHTGRVHRIAYVGGVGKATKDDPRYNLMADPYYTDGRRAVFLLFEPKRVPLIDGRHEFLPAEKIL